MLRRLTPVLTILVAFVLDTAVVPMVMVPREPIMPMYAKGPLKMWATHWVSH